MIGYLKAEKIKLKSSTSKRILLMIPLFFLIFSLFTVLFMSREGTFNGYLAQIFNQWPLGLLPIGLAIACSLNIGQEKKSGDYKIIIANRLSLTKTWNAKVINIAYYQLISSIIIIIVAIGGSTVVYGKIPDIFNIIYTTALITLASLPLIPFNFIVSHFFGTIITTIMNLLGAFISVVWLAPYRDFWVTPWGNMLRIPAATMGIHPNGTSIEPGDSLRDTSILVTSVIISVTYFVLFTMITTVFLKKKVAK